MEVQALEIGICKRIHNTSLIDCASNAKSKHEIAEN